MSHFRLRGRKNTSPEEPGGESSSSSLLSLGGGCPEAATALSSLALSATPLGLRPSAVYTDPYASSLLRWGGYGLAYVHVLMYATLAPMHPRLCAEGSVSSSTVPSLFDALRPAHRRTRTTQEKERKNRQVWVGGCPGNDGW